MCFLSLMSGEGILCALHTRWCEISFLLLKRRRWSWWRIPANVRPGWPFRSRLRRPSSISRPRISFQMSDEVDQKKRQLFFSLTDQTSWRVRKNRASGERAGLSLTLHTAVSANSFFFISPQGKHSHHLCTVSSTVYFPSAGVHGLLPVCAPPWPPAPHCTVSTGAATDYPSKFLLKKLY